MDPLVPMEVTKWNDLKEIFKVDWPKGITGYYALEGIEKFLKQNADYGFKVLTPREEAKNGMIFVLKDEEEFLEMLIEWPQEDTSGLAEAIKRSNLIDRYRDIVVIFTRKHVAGCLTRTAEEMNMNLGFDPLPLKLYILDKESPLYNVRLPKGFTFKHLTEDHIELTDSTWPHRYPGSTKYYELLIQTKSGYGLFKDNQLVSFGFIKEMGALGHLYTLEEHRRKGYGEMVTKLISNEILKQKKDVFSVSFVDNINSCKMHEKLGFTESDIVYTVKLTPKIKLSSLLK